MISTNDILEDIIRKNREFNEVLDANQKGYEVRYFETNNISKYESFPGFKIISIDSDNIFTKVRVFLRTNPLTPTRLNEKPKDTNKEHFLQISYKNGMGGMVINMEEISKSQLKKLIEATEKA